MSFRIPKCLLVLMRKFYHKKPICIIQPVLDEYNNNNNNNNINNNNVV